jgi:hypothetical protein
MFNPFEKSSLTWLFVLLPGFLSLQVVNYLLPKDAPQVDMQLISLGLSFSVANFVIFLVLHQFISRLKGKSTKGLDIDYFKSIRIGALGLISMLIISVGTGYLVAVVDSNDFIYKTISPTSRVTTQLDTFAAVFERNQKKKESIVVIKTKSGDKYWGWPYLYSTGTKGSEVRVLYMEPAGRIKDGCALNTYTKEKAKVCSHSILNGLMLFENEISSVEFLKDGE